MSLENFNPSFLQVTEHGDVVVARLTRPHLNDEENIDQLGLEMFALVDQYEKSQIVLDLEAVEYATSSVIGKIIGLHRKLGRGEGRLVLCRLSETVRDVLATAKLLEYFDVAESVADAVRRFDADA